jgi:hypothetical protein
MPIPAAPGRRGSVGTASTRVDRRFEAVVFDWDGTAVLMSDATMARRIGAAVEDANHA